MPLSPLLINDVPIECINKAAVTYKLPPELIIAVLRTENGRKDMARPNKNGTFDYGPMQINTIWLSQIQQYGYTKDMILHNPCLNVWVGTWILAQEVAANPNFWRGVGSYHSRTQSKNVPYQYKVWQNYLTLHNLLQA
jgi:soluble lytic murein transglycosylase-like protein